MAASRGRRPGITPATVNHYKRRIDPDTHRYYSDAKIARILGVTSSAIYDVRKRYPGLIEKSPDEVADSLWPWDVPTEFHRSAQYNRLRDHLRWAARRGAGLSPKRLSLLQGFYNRLKRNDWVVEYDPTIPPHNGAWTGGWAYRPRQESDGDLIIRANEHTKKLSEEASLVWEFPPVEPGA